jgi:heme exporter protein D
MNKRYLVATDDFDALMWAQLRQRIYMLFVIVPIMPGGTAALLLGSDAQLQPGGSAFLWKALALSAVSILVGGLLLVTERRRVAKIVSRMRRVEASD